MYLIRLKNQKLNLISPKIRNQLSLLLKMKIFLSLVAIST